MGCPLCERERKTKFYYEDSLVWIVLCETCGVPLGIFKRHTLKVKPSEERHMEQMLNRVGLWVFGDGRFRIDRNMQKIKDHLHYHLRPR